MVCLQEVRWRGSSARWLGSQGSRYKFFWQGCPDGTAGVGVLVAERWVDQVVSVTRVNARLMAVKLVVGERLMNIISAYAPQVGRCYEDKQRFWDDMYDFVGGTPDGEAVFLGGDLNGRVGRDAEGYEGVHGGFGFGSRNVEGE